MIPSTAVSALVLLAAAAIIYLVFRLRFERWKGDFEQQIRRDAAQRSQATIVGKVYEQLVPYLPAFEWNPQDARFLGSPVDFLVFDGLSDDAGDAVRSVIFVEVKTGGSSVNRRQRLVRDAVIQRRVEWRELRLPQVP